MPSHFFAGRISLELRDRINEHCEKTGESRTQVLINALSKYLDFPIRPPVTTTVSIEMFNELEQRVAELEKKQAITAVNNTDNNLNTNLENTNVNVENKDNDDNPLITNTILKIEKEKDIVPKTENLTNLVNGYIEPISEVEMANLTNETRSALSYHRKKFPGISKRVIINGKTYDASYIGEGRSKTKKFAALWDATPVLDTDNAQYQEVALNFNSDLLTSEQPPDNR